MQQSEYNRIVRYLKGYGINCLYHITSRENWPSIRTNGLFSACQIETKGISAVYGSDKLDRYLNRHSGKRLDEYVHLSFSAIPPFRDRLVRSGRCKGEPIVLKVGLDVLKDADLRFCATDPLLEDAVIKNDLVSFLDMDLEIAGKGENLDLSTIKERQLSGATILLKDHIPFSFIQNSDELDFPESNEKGESLKQGLVMLMIDRSWDMGRPIYFHGRQYESTLGCALSLANEAISTVLLSCDEETTDYAICVMGYNDNEVESIFSGSLEGKKLISGLDLICQPAGYPRKKAKKWVSCDYSKTKADPAFALEEAATIVESWAENHRDGLRPIIINLTDARSMRDKTFPVEKAVRRLKNVNCQGGEPILLNYQISSEKDKYVAFPNEDALSVLNNMSQFLYSISSTIEDDPFGEIGFMQTDVKNKSPHIPCRAMSINGDLEKMLGALLKGTRNANPSFAANSKEPGKVVK